MSRNPNTESNRVGYGPMRIDQLDTGETLSYWASRTAGYAALGVGIFFGVGTLFFF